MKSYNEKMDAMLLQLKQGKLKERPKDVLAWDELEVDLSIVIGEGGFGRVFKGRWNSITVAVKQLNAAAFDDHDLRKGART